MAENLFGLASHIERIAGSKRELEPIEAGVFDRRLCLGTLDQHIGQDQVECWRNILRVDHKPKLPRGLVFEGQKRCAAGVSRGVGCVPLDPLPFNDGVSILFALDEKFSCEHIARPKPLSPGATLAPCPFSGEVVVKLYNLLFKREPCAFRFAG